MRELLERLKKLAMETSVSNAAELQTLASSVRDIAYIEELCLDNEKRAAEQASLSSMVADQAKGG